MREYCKDRTQPVVRECPDCLDAYFKLAEAHEARLREVEDERDLWERRTFEADEDYVQRKGRYIRRIKAGEEERTTLQRCLDREEENNNLLVKEIKEIEKAVVTPSSNLLVYTCRVCDQVGNKRHEVVHLEVCPFRTYEEREAERRLADPPPHVAGSVLSAQKRGGDDRRSEKACDHKKVEGVDGRGVYSLAVSRTADHVVICLDCRTITHWCNYEDEAWKGSGKE